MHCGGTFLPRELSVQRRFAGCALRFRPADMLASVLLCIGTYVLAEVGWWFVVSPDGAFARGLGAGGLLPGTPVTQVMV